MAAGPISERNQGEWEERAQNGPSGAGRLRGVPAVFPRGRELGHPGGRETGRRACWGRGGRVQAQALEVRFSVQSSAFPPPHPPKKFQKENLQQNSKFDLKSIL